ncbi:MAG: hypothetical protein K2J18_03715, partial [Paramuribaculum sp.]|nr:hypothetical protein [Paramuribaculum sp.]
MKTTAIALAVCALWPLSLLADDSEPKLSVKPTGRILMDGAAYFGGNDGITEYSGDTRFVDGVAIPDLRLGVKASYGRWK